MSNLPQKLAKSTAQPILDQYQNAMAKNTNNLEKMSQSQLLDNLKAITIMTELRMKLIENYFNEHQYDWEFDEAKQASQKAMAEVKQLKELVFALQWAETPQTNKLPIYDIKMTD